MIKIPSPTSVWSKYGIVLEEIFFTFEYQWNERDSSWHLSVFDTQNKPLIYNIKLLPWVALFLIHPQTGNPLGELMVIDNEESFGKGSGRPDTSGFNGRFNLVYITSTEIVG